MRDFGHLPRLTFSSATTAHFAVARPSVSLVGPGHGCRSISITTLPHGNRDTAPLRCRRSPRVNQDRCRKSLANHASARDVVLVVISAGSKIVSLSVSGLRARGSSFAVDSRRFVGD